MKTKPNHIKTCGMQLKEDLRKMKCFISYILKGEKSEVSSLSFHFKKIEKRGSV
jgi:hypothetical protein